MRRALLTVLALAAVACSGDDDSAPDGDETASSVETTAPVETATDADADADGTPLPERFDLTFTLPAPPDDLDVPEPVFVPGETVDPARINTDAQWLWCDETEGTPIVTLAIGDVWQTGEGAGVAIEINPLSVGGGNDLALPTLPSDVVVFFLDIHDIVGLPQEYSSVQEESFGTITVDAVPCVGQGDVLDLTIDGALGAETNPGFISATLIEGGVRLGVTGPPPF